MNKREKKLSTQKLHIGTFQNNTLRINNRTAEQSSSFSFAIRRNYSDSNKTV